MLIFDSFKSPNRICSGLQCARAKMCATKIMNVSHIYMCIIVRSKECSRDREIESETKTLTEDLYLTAVVVHTLIFGQFSICLVFSAANADAAPQTNASHFSLSLRFLCSRYPWVMVNRAFSFWLCFFHLLYFILDSD